MPQKNGYYHGYVIVNLLVKTDTLLFHQGDYDGITPVHRRHRKLVWDIYSTTDFSHLKQGGG